MTVIGDHDDDDDDLVEVAEWSLMQLLPAVHVHVHNERCRKRRPSDGIIDPDNQLMIIFCSSCSSSWGGGYDSFSLHVDDVVWLLLFLRMLLVFQELGNQSSFFLYVLRSYCSCHDCSLDVT